ncbi:phage major capsid protein [Chitinilyticum aquatile]|uniref:phage major capsid protein n=1 Tax=Chitinilyticum aquatile TaxID=362520 RepID=UPI000414760A|nr:phage major capsid protein [Chitinilyticum aquatile]
MPKPTHNTAHRHFEVRADAINAEERTLTLSFSSEEPYQRWWGVEILDHKPESVRMGRLLNKAPLLMDHNTRDQIGVVESATLNGRGESVVRFSRAARADEIFQDVKDAIRTKVSVGYIIHDLVLESKNGELETYRVTDWEPYEISIVSVPADDTVGVGRSADDFDPRSLAATRADPEPADDAEPQASTETPDIHDLNEEKSIMTVQVQDPQAAVAAERSRVSEINAIGRQFGMTDAAARAVESGMAVDTFRIQVMDDLSKQKDSGVRHATASDVDVGLTDQEADRFSLRRLVASVADPTTAHAAGFELEACRAAAQKRGQIANGKGTAFCIPQEVVMRKIMRPMARDLVVGTASAGGNLVATDLEVGSFIELLINRLALTQLGITKMTGLVGNIAIPRQTGGVATYWVAENGAPTESQASFDQIALTPKTIAAFTEVSRLLLQQSSIDVESFMQFDLLRSMGLGLDLAGIAGSGASNQPRGILNTAGIGSVAGGANGAAITWDHFVDLESAVANLNADAGAMKYLTNTKVRGKAKKTQQFSGTNGFSLWDAVKDDTVISNQIPSNLTKGSSSGVCSAIIYGNWADLVMGLWGGLDLLVDPYSNSTTGAVRVTAFQSADFNARQPASFSAMTDALTV